MVGEDGGRSNKTLTAEKNKKREGGEAQLTHKTKMSETERGVCGEEAGKYRQTPRREKRKKREEEEEEDEDRGGGGRGRPKAEGRGPKRRGRTGEEGGPGRDGQRSGAPQSACGVAAWRLVTDAAGRAERTRTDGRARDMRTLLLPPLVDTRAPAGHQRGNTADARA